MPPRRVEPLTQILEDVIAVHAHAMAGVHRGSRSSDENSARYEMLKMSLGGEQSFPVGKVGGR